MVLCGGSSFRTVISGTLGPDLGAKRWLCFHPVVRWYLFVGCSFSVHFLGRNGRMDRVLVRIVLFDWPVKLFPGEFSFVPGELCVPLHLRIV